MSRKAELPQSRRHVLVFDEDWDWLDTNFGRYSTSKIGAGVAVRKIVHAHVRSLKQRAIDELDGEVEASGDGQQEEATA